jgi:hypothetical protein
MQAPASAQWAEPPYLSFAHIQNFRSHPMTYFSFASQGKILFLSNPSSTQNNQPVWRYRVIPALFTACLAGMLVSNAQAARPLASPALAAAASQPTIYGPIVITSGGTYSGTLISDNTQIPAVTIETDEPVVITNSTITSKGPLISIAGTGTGANVTITNTTGIGLDPGVKGQQRGVFLTANNVSSLVVQNTSVSGTSFGVKSTFLHSGQPQYLEQSRHPSGRSREQWPGRLAGCKA